MTVENAIKKLEKLGKVEKVGSFYGVKLENKMLKFIRNGGELGNAVCFHIDHYNEKQEKYHTTYFDNVTQMIKYATR